MKIRIFWILVTKIFRQSDFDGFWTGLKKIFKSGQEAVEVGLAENLSAKKSDFLKFQLEFLP